MSRSVLAALLLVACAGAEVKAETPSAKREPPQTVAVQSTEALPPEQVLFSFRGRVSEVRNCFHAAPSGFVRLSWRVNGAGEVTDSHISESTVRDTAVETCLSQFVRDLTFERNGQARSASWTFVHGVAARSERQRRGRSKSSARAAGVLLEPGSPGRLSVSEIESVAEHGFRLYGFCLREGLNRDIRLNGRVELRFTIDDDGSVRNVSDAGSDLGDFGVIDCVAEAFYALRFPEPDGGSVHLRYSFLLNED